MRAYNKLIITLVTVLVFMPLSVTNAGFFDWLKPLFEPGLEEPVDEQLGAPTAQYTRNLFPFATSTYEVGTSTAAYLSGTYDTLCLTADSCITTWSAGADTTNTVEWIQDQAWNIGGGTQTGMDTSIFNSATPFNLGARYSSTGYYDGLMQDAIIWNAELTSAQVLSLYNLYTTSGIFGSPIFFT